MKNLTALLERFTKSLHKDTDTKEAVAQAILHATGISISPDNLSLKDGVLKIVASPVALNEMRLKEESIKGELKERKVPLTRIIYT